MNYHDPKEIGEAYGMLCCMVWVKRKKVWNELMAMKETCWKVYYVVLHLHEGW